jgi:hypothetical protein
MAELGDEFPICLEILQPSDIRVLKCLHNYHKECIKDWSMRSNLCPLCNNSIVFVSDKSKDSKNKLIFKKLNIDYNDTSYRCTSCTIS